MALNINGTTGISGVDGSASSPALQGTDSNTGINFASDTVNINTGGVTRATVDSSGNLNIPNDSGKIQLGTSSDLQIYHDGSNSYFKNAGTGNIIYLSDDVQFKSDGGGNTGLTINTDGAVELYHNNSKKCSTITTGIEVHGSTDSARIEFNDAYSNSRIGFFGLNRFGIDAHDGLEVRDPSDSFATRLKIDADGKLEAFGNRASSNAQLFQNISSTDPEGLYIQFTQAAPNTASRHFLFCSDNAATRMTVDSNGNCRNINASYGGFSDVSLKENIVDAGSQWDDIKNTKVRVFNFKTDDASEKRIGVIAQEIETVCPKLVEDVFDKDGDGNLLKTSKKSVKYSVLYMKAIKALQEAQTRIETLEAEKTQMQTDLTALTARVAALEAG